MGQGRRQDRVQDRTRQDRDQGCAGCGQPAAMAAAAAVLPVQRCDCRTHTVLHHPGASRGRVHELGRSVRLHVLSAVDRCCLLLT